MRPITTVLAPSSSYDLVTLSVVKDELNIKDQNGDDFLMRIISQMSGAISQYCNRVFQDEIVQDLIYFENRAFAWQDMRTAQPVQLSRWPIINFDYVSLTGNTHGTITVDNLSTTAGLSVGLPVFGTGIPAGASIETLNTSGSSLTLTSAATATATGVSLTTGISVVQQTNGTTQTLVSGTDFKVDAVRGQLFRLSSMTGQPVKWEPWPLTVTYSGGYDVIPFDVVEATLRWITLRYAAKSRDPNLRTRDIPGVGTETYWVGGPPMSGSVPQEIAGILDNYRGPTLS